MCVCVVRERKCYKLGYTACYSDTDSFRFVIGMYP